jgi:pyruvate,water dikinase
VTSDAASTVVGQGDVATAPILRVGAKAAALARLSEAGFPVPSFFVIASAAFGRHLCQRGVSWPPSLDGSADPEAASALRARIMGAPMDPTVARQVLDAYHSLSRESGHPRVAVRSSDSEEDAAAASFAGQFRSLLNLDGSALLDTVKLCWSSYFSDQAVRYRAAAGIPFGPQPGFGVLVQVQVFAQKAGVMFTVHPMDSGAGVAYIEANFGTGESVVGGLVTPDSITVSRRDPASLDMVTATKRRVTWASRDTPGTTLADTGDAERTAPVLDRTQVQELLAMALRIEDLMGCPQDIEWAYDNRQLWILQARPITRSG